MNVACLLSVMLQPYMPGTSKILQDQLNAPSSVNVLSGEFVCLLKPSHVIGKPSPLFQKIEAAKAEEFRKKFAGTPNVVTDIYIIHVTMQCGIVRVWPEVYYLSGF